MTAKRKKSTTKRIAVAWGALNEDGRLYCGSVTAKRADLLAKCNAGAYGVLMPKIVAVEVFLAPAKKKEP